MSIEKDIFKRNKFDYDKVLDYGFVFYENKYNYSINILNNSFRVDLTIINDELVGKIYDLNFNDEYTNFRIDNLVGDFVGKVRDEYINILIDIRNKCTNSYYFIFDQTNRIVNKIYDKYGDGPSFEWADTPGCAAIKNRDTGKWYGLVTNIDKSKLDSNFKGEIEIINVKLKPEEIIELLNENGFYPAYHMNKKNWISIILDDTLDDNIIMELIDESYLYSFKK